MPVRISGIENGICIAGQDEEMAWAERETAFPLYLQPNSNQKSSIFSYPSLIRKWCSFAMTGGKRRIYDLLFRILK